VLSTAGMTPVEAVETLMIRLRELGWLEGER
jgi:hypothetical protein